MLCLPLSSSSCVMTHRHPHKFPISVLALWIQSSRIYEQPLNALQVWRRGSERGFFSSFFFTSHSSFLRILSLLALIPPISFPANLHSTKGPAKELMTWLKHAPNQGQALIGILTDLLCLIRILIDTISHNLLLKWAHIKRICSPSFAGTDCCSLSQNIMNHKCQLWLWSKLL